ncbi:MAG: M28 family metallopeptidase [Candidatus Aquicultorales bacterium]
MNPIIDVEAALTHIGHLSQVIGARFPGSDEETRAADYVARELVKTGRPVELQFFDLPNGKRSRNVSIFLPGASRKEFVIGAHIDTAPETPGANDNASGVAVVLELAKAFSKSVPPADMRFIFFGGEELVKKGQLHHHFGSRAFVASLCPEERDNISGMVSIDMAGCGEGLKVHTGRDGSPFVRDGLMAGGRRLGVRIEHLTTHAASDHESFEQHDIPACWIGYFRDAANHTVKDTIERISAVNLETIAGVVYAFVRNACAVKAA